MGAAAIGAALGAGVGLLKGIQQEKAAELASSQNRRIAAEQARLAPLLKGPHPSLSGLTSQSSGGIADVILGAQAGSLIGEGLANTQQPKPTIENPAQPAGLGLNIQDLLA